MHNYKKMKNLMLSILFAMATSSCSTVEFNTSGRETFTVAARASSEKQVEVETTKDFYFWGLAPSKEKFNLQDETNGLGIYNPGYVTVEQKYTAKDIFFTLVTFGLYCPVTYKVTLLTNRELK